MNLFQELTPLKAIKNKQPKVSYRWKPPTEGMYKFNCDATVFAHGRIGIRAAIRNHGGEFLFAMASSFSGQMNEVVAKA